MRLTMRSAAHMPAATSKNEAIAAPMPMRKK
jgi:hypothetical protein